MKRYRPSDIPELTAKARRSSRSAKSAKLKSEGKCVACSSATNERKPGRSTCIKCNAKVKLWYKKNPGSRKEYIKAWRGRNKERSALLAKNGNLKIKLRVIKKYGGSCACCQEDELGFLTIDHTAGDGGKHRKKLGNKGRGTRFYKWLDKRRASKKLRVLCFNCNLGIQVNGGVCPHEIGQAGWLERAILATEPFRDLDLAAAMQKRCAKRTRSRTPPSS